MLGALVFCRLFTADFFVCRTKGISPWAVEHILFLLSPVIPSEVCRFACESANWESIEPYLRCAHTPPRSPIIVAVDNASRIERSRQMSLVRSKDTKPEMSVRRLVYAMGFRYRLHQANLPGKPDLVFRSQRKVIFVHGCFWHRHKCRLGRMPKSRLEYWRPKITGNRDRDVRTLRRLRGMRWRVLVLWECQLRNRETLVRRIQTFLSD